MKKLLSVLLAVCLLLSLSACGSASMNAAADQAPAATAPAYKQEIGFDSMTGGYTESVTSPAMPAPTPTVDAVEPPSSTLPENV